MTAISFNSFYYSFRKDIFQSWKNERTFSDELYDLLQLYPQMTSDMANNDAAATSSGRIRKLMESEDVDSLSDVVKSNTFAVG